MKRIGFVVFILMLVLSTTVSGVEIGANFKIGNLGLGTGTKVPTKFSASNFDWGFNLSANQPMSDNFNIEVGLDYDPILRNLGYTQVQYKTSIVTLGIGPFFGLFNSSQTPLKSGLSTSVRLEAPGLAFVSFKADSSIGGGIAVSGDYLQERNEASIGFYVHNAICSFNLDTKTFEEKDKSTTVSSEFSEYSFKVDLFKKNVPYNLVLNFAYQELTKSDDTTKAVLNSIVLGTKMTVPVAKGIKAVVDLESNLYSFGKKDLSPTIPNDRYLFRMSVGTIINLEELNGKKESP
jgi:hypothetical protein